MNVQAYPDVRFLMGNEAVARGVIEAGCTVAAAYPGTPSSEVLESLVRWKKELDHPIYLEWSINEKVAFEAAYGASLSGARSMAAMKMVGLNVASDPFLSAAYLGVRGGLVVVVADDPGPHSSQTEQDSRFFAWFGKVPVFDPATPSEARLMTIKAFDLSEKYQVPVLLRPCLRVCHARQNVALGEPIQPVNVGPFKRNWQRWAAIPRFRLVLHGELNEKLAKIVSDEPETKPVLIAGNPRCKAAVITSGSVSSHVRDIVASDAVFGDIAVFKVDIPFPADSKALQEIVDSYAKVVIIEETYPVLELQIPDHRKVVGRLSGLVPSQGELTPELVEDILAAAMDKPLRAKPSAKIAPRRPSLCAGCPHRSAFFTMKKVFDKAVYTSDIGCYTLGINLGAVDTCLCMGASLGMAAGFAKSPFNSDGTVVATIGDSTFYHSGVPALINAVHTKAKTVLIILDNNITAMTGGQPTPAHDYLADGSAGVKVDLERLVHGCGVEFVQVIDPYDYQKAEQAMIRAGEYTFENGSGIAVLIARRPCVRTPGMKPSSDRYCVTDDCDRCMTCIRDLECPAIHFEKEEKRMEINEDLCAGCGFCVQICPSKAITLKGAR